MSVKHKWHKEIKAWADGAKIEFKDEADLDEWLDTDAPFWEECDGIEYRIKPQPNSQQCCCQKVTPSPQYLYVYGYSDEIKLWYTKTPAKKYLGKIKLEVGDENL